MKLVLKRSCSALLCMGLLVLLTACSREQPVKGFVLPEGNVDNGKEVFIAFNCYRCHNVAGVELPERNFEPPFVVELGGEVLRVKDYGELLTAIVDPDHVISPKYKASLKQIGKNPDQSPMPYFGDMMTVTELTDLVEFLHAQYSRKPYELYRGHYYYTP
jgi:sulfur-oxidizing protein SoxX